jgi:ADP-heptose:LPS heptosyltransferase
LAAARGFFEAQALDPVKPTLVIQPFTSSPQKDWPFENYLAVARRWQATGVQVIFVGGPADRPRLEPARQEKFCVATGLPLLVSAGLVHLATLALGGDTGLGHLAVALERRVVMLMRDNRPGSCVPFQHPAWAVAPAHPGRIQEIAVETVMAEMAKTLAPA